METNWSGSAIEGLLAAGEIVPAQASSVCIWSPEKSLAAAVLATALTEIRDHYGNPGRCNAIADELAWIRSDANDRLYSFLRVCELLNVDPDWVRETVNRWCEAGRRGRARFTWRGAA
jgi:hypothetical protein